VKFEWDEHKRASNFEKHGVDFLEATEAFDDEFGFVFFDDRHGENEERFILIGMTRAARLLLIVHTWRSDVIRLISARPTTLKERELYDEQF
jgi:hypothetical protein